LLSILVFLFGCWKLWMVRSDSPMRGQVTGKGSGEEGTLPVLKANRDMPIGSLVSPQDFQLVTIDAGLAVEDGVTDIGRLKDMRLAVAMKKNQLLKGSDLIQEGYFFKPDDRLIEQTFLPEEIPSDCREGSLMDIRLFRRTGKDPLVISKAFVIKRTESTLVLYADQMEQELLKQAQKEGPLYISLYGDPRQEASQVDYIPKYGGVDDEGEDHSGVQPGE